MSLSVIGMTDQRQEYDHVPDPHIAAGALMNPNSSAMQSMLPPAPSNRPSKRSHRPSTAPAREDVQLLPSMPSIHDLLSQSLSDANSL